jgi:hypothetical protein
MTEPDEVKEMLNRFERVIDISEAKDSDDIIRKFAYFQNRKVSPKQKILLEKYAKQKGIGIIVEKPRFSRSYRTFEHWKAKSPSKTIYKTRISRYMIKHPKATLTEARGHLRKK